MKVCCGFGAIGMIGPKPEAGSAPHFMQYGVGGTVDKYACATITGPPHCEQVPMHMWL